VREDELPEGWIPAQLETLVVHILGGDWGVEAETRRSGWSTVKVIRGTDFKDWSSQRGATAPLRAIKDSSLQKRQLAPGDIVLEVSGGGPDQPVGRTLLVDEPTIHGSPEPFVCSNFCRQVRLTKEVDAGFVNLFLRHLYGIGALDRFQNQTTNLRNLQVGEFLSETTVPLPSMLEQKRIVAKVGELLASVNAARDRLARIPAILKRFRLAVLAAACEGRLTEEWRMHRSVGPELERRPEPEIEDKGGWAEVRLEALIDPERSAAYGVLQPGDDVVDGVPFVRVGDIVGGAISTFGLKRISPTISRKYPRTLLSGGEVLVTLVGTIGRVAVVPCDLEGANVARAVAVLPLAAGVDSRFVSLALQEPAKNSELRDLAREVARKTLNLGLLKNVAIVLPPLTEQREIVRRVEDFFAHADAIEKRLAAATTRADSMTQAVLAKAFRGALEPSAAELTRS
jgi:type I restriction enzyme, S subunit